MAKKKSEMEELLEELAAEGEPAGEDDPTPGDGDAEIVLEVSGDVLEQIEQLMAERDAAVEARKRALADFANFQRRAAENEIRASREGARTVFRSMLSVLDHVDLALDQPTDQLTVEQLMDGVRLVRDELLKVLETNGVRIVRPEPGDEFDPNLHAAMMRQPSEDIPPNHIVSVFQCGYAMGDVVLRPASVTVAAEEE